MNSPATSDVSRWRFPRPALALVTALLTATGAAAQAPSGVVVAANPAAALVRQWTSADRLERSNIETKLLAGAEDSLDVLHELLVSGSLDEQQLAASLLGVMRDQGAVPALIAEALSGSRALRRDALIALRRIASEDSAAAIRTLLVADDDATITRNALAVLGRVGGGSGDRLLAHAKAAHADPVVRVTAAGVLAALGDDGLESVLLSAAASDDSLTRLTALYYLGETDSEAGARVLAAIVADPDAPWRSYARIAQEMRALRALQAADRTAALAALASDDNTTVARWAIETLADDGGTAALAALATAAASETRAAAMAERQLVALGGRP